jgi:hypothetical protein
MSRDRLEHVVKDIENLFRSDLECSDDLNAAYRKIEEEQLEWANENLRTKATPDEVAWLDKVAWVPPDPLSAHHLRLDLALWFVENSKRCLSGDANTLDSELGLPRRRGKPFDPTTSENLDPADEGFRLRYECGRPWKDVESQLDIDERTIRKLIESHFLAICRRRADAIVKRLPKIPPIERIKPALNSTE